MKMTDKKKTVKSKKVKNTSSPKIEPKIIPKEDVYPVIEIAQMLDISSFELFRLKQEAGIHESSFLTISQFTEIYNKIIKGR